MAEKNAKYLLSTLREMIWDCNNLRERFNNSFKKLLEFEARIQREENSTNDSTIEQLQFEFDCKFAEAIVNLDRWTEMLEIVEPPYMDYIDSKEGRSTTLQSRIADSTELFIDNYRFIYPLQKIGERCEEILHLMLDTSWQNIPLYKPEIPDLGTTHSIWFYLQHPLKAADKKRQTLKLLIERLQVFSRHLSATRPEDSKALKELTLLVDTRTEQFKTEYESYAYISEYIKYVYDQWVGTEEYMYSGDFWDIKYSVINHIEPEVLEDEFYKLNQSCISELDRLRTLKKDDNKVLRITWDTHEMDSS